MNAKARRKAKRAANQIAAQVAKELAPQLPPRQPPRNSQAWKILRVCLAIGGWIVAAPQFVEWWYGALWPMSLQIFPNSVSASDPFHVPFSVKNPSKLDLTVETFVCRIIDIRTAQGPRFDHTTLQKNASGGVVPSEGTVQYTCPRLIDARQLQITTAVIEIVAMHPTVWPFPSESNSGPLVWHPETIPPTWLAGENR